MGQKCYKKKKKHLLAYRRLNENALRPPLVIEELAHSSALIIIYN